MHGIRDGETGIKDLGMSEKSRKGTIMELKAIVSLMKKGCHVSKSVDPQCPFDLVAVHPDGKIDLIDVKSMTYRVKDNTKIHRSLTKNQKQFQEKTGLTIKLEMMK